MEGKKEYDLEKRTNRFAKEIISFCKLVSINQINNPMINQLVKSGTSQAANYYEANESESKKDFVHKISIAKKEVKETKLWIELLAHSDENVTEKARILWKEAHELNLIFASIIRSTKKLLKNEN